MKAASLWLTSLVAGRSVSPITASGSTVVPNRRLATPRHLGLLLGEGAGAGERRRRADAPQVRRLAGIPNAADEQRDVGALAAAVRVQLVEHQEREALRRPDERLVVRAREDVLEHHVVGQQDVRRMRADLLALLVVLLPGEAAERHRARGRPDSRG